MNIIYETNMVKWVYNGNEIMYTAKGIEFATPGEQSIYIELFYGDIFEYRFVDFTGENICRYDENNVLTIYAEGGKKFENQLKEINDVLFFYEKIYVMNKRTEIRVYNRNGECEGLIKPPNGYIYTRFLNDSKLEVICEGDISQADSYGRVDYKFEYDIICNNWEKKTVIY